jgi:hypothetical protein
MCVIDIDDYCTVWEEHQHRARKPHKCSCCRRQIEPGETYVAHFSIFYGDCTSEKCCADCEKDRQEFAEAHDGAMRNPGSFPMMVSDCISEGDEEDAAWEAMLTRIRGRRKAGV